MKYKPYIYKKIYKFNFFEDNEDIFQQCMFVVYKCIFSFKDTNTFYSYVSRAIINKINSFYKELRKKHQNESIIEEEILKECMPYSYSDEIMSMDFLTPKEKLIVRLFYLENLSVPKISEGYGVTKYAVYNILKRAKKKIKDNI